MRTVYKVVITVKKIVLVYIQIESILLDSIIIGLTCCWARP